MIAVREPAICSTFAEIYWNPIGCTAFAWAVAGG
jgi:hypothetical protein